MQRKRVEQGTDFMGRKAVLTKGSAVDRRASLGRGVESQDEPHGCALARAVGSEESGDAAGLDLEGQTVHRGGVVVAFREVVDFDHRYLAAPPRQMWVA